MSKLVGKAAPDFSSAAVLANGEIENQFNLLHEIKNKYVYDFFIP